MATPSVTHVLSNGTTVDAPQLNTNYDDLVSFLAASVLHLDGSQAMSGDLNMATNDILNIGSGYIFGPEVAFVSTSSFVKASYPNLRAIISEVMGGGAGGGGVDNPTTGEGGYAAGGGGGGYSRKFILASALSASETVTIGAGGAGGSGTPTAGVPGGSSSFGSHHEGYGGGGGTGATCTTGQSWTYEGVGGGQSSGDFGRAGGSGMRGLGVGTVPGQVGAGGDSYFAPMALDYTNNSSTSVGGAGKGYGGGGGGAYSRDATGSAAAGGAGAPGIVIVRLLF